MKKEIVEALSNLDLVIKGVNLSREYHDTLRDNLNLIGKTITELEEELTKLKTIEPLKDVKD